MHLPAPRPVVHLELHTPDQARASAFYTKLLCWRTDLIEAGSGSYLALELGGGLGGGIVECGTRCPLWLPYVEVGQVEESTEHARRLGASVLLDERLPEQSQQATLRSLGDAALRQVVERYVAAWERNDVDAVVAMLAEDARMAMPPLPTWYRGRQQVGTFLSGGPLAGATRWRLIPARANGQVAFGAYRWDQTTQAFLPRGVSVLTLRGTQIEEITAFLTPGAFRRFSLPSAIPACS